MSEKVIVEMTREQAQAVMDATELLARLEIGQFEEITWKLIDHFRGKSKNGKLTFDNRSRELADAYLKCACMAVFGVRNGWPDIGDKNMQHHRCWAVYATIRHALAWHDYPEGGDTVDFDKPLGYGEPLPNKQNEALFIMRTGKDYVYGTMPYARAAKMCDDGNVAKGDNPDYPVALDDKYFFSGQVVEVEAAARNTEPAEKPKKKLRK